MFNLLLLCIHANGVAAQTQEVAFIPMGSTHVFWKTMQIGAQKAASDLNLTLHWRGPLYENDTNSQIELVHRFTEAGVDAIVLVPLDRQLLVEPVRKAVSQGIRVVVVDSALDGSDYVSFIGTNNSHGGRMAAKHLVTLLNGQGDVILLRYKKGTSSTDNREQGFIDGLSSLAPGIQLISDEYGGTTAGEAYRKAKNVLKSVPKVDGVFCVNESTTTGMLKALRQTKLAGRVKFVGFDSSEPLLEGIQRREIHGLIAQNPGRMGYIGVQSALAAIENESVEPIIYVDAVLVTPDNYLSPEIQAIIHLHR